MHHLVGCERGDDIASHALNVSRFDEFLSILLWAWASCGVRCGWVELHFLLGLFLSLLSRAECLSAQARAGIDDGTDETRVLRPHLIAKGGLRHARIEIVENKKIVDGARSEERRVGKE